MPKNIFVRLLNKLGLLPFLSLTTIIEVNQRKIKIPIIEKNGLINLRLSENWMTELLLKLVPAFSGNFIDVGVNLSQTLIKVVGVFDNFSYVGFEPNPVCYSYSKKFIKINNLKNCEIIPVGIGSKNEILSLLFFSDTVYDESATIVEGFRDDSTIIKREFVPIFDGASMSKFLPQQKGSILKIDVEGAELEVIEGLIDWITYIRPIIIVEILPVYTEENTFRLTRQKNLEKLLLNSKFSIARINKCGNEIRLIKLDALDINKDIEQSDYLFIPQEREQEIFKLINLV